MLLNSFSILFIDLFIFLLQHFLSNAGDCSDEICMFTSLTIIWPDRGLCGGQLAGGGAMATEHRRIAFKLSMFNLDKWLSTVVAPELNFIIRVLK